MLPEPMETDGNLSALPCPYCFEDIRDLWDTDSGLYAQEGEHGCECPHCEKRFTVKTTVRINLRAVARSAP